MKVQLREYQKPALMELKKWIVEEKDTPLLNAEVPGINRNAVLYAPCGFGKTIIACTLMTQAAQQGIPSIFVMSMDDLVTQTVHKLQGMFDVAAPRVIKAGTQWKGLIDSDSLIMVGGIGTMCSRGLFPEAKLIIIDEAHTCVSDSYKPLFDRFPESWIIGLTATPLRTKKTEGMSQRFSKLIVPVTMADLIDIGRQTDFKEGLVPFEYFGFPKDRALNVDDVRTTGGDYNQRELQAKCDTPMAIENAIEGWRSRIWDARPGDPRRTIVFCTGIEHSQHMADAFNAKFAEEFGRDIALAIDGSASFEERQSAYNRLRSGDIRVLTSVSLLTTGFDVVEVECILDCAPTKSLSRHIQKYGRGSRTAPHIGKRDCIILDQAGNVVRHKQNGFVEDYVPTELDEPGKPEAGDAPMKMCPPDFRGGCGKLLYAFQMRCPHCGYEFPQKPLVERVGEMVALLKGEDKKHHRTYVRYLKQAFKEGFLPEWANYKTVVKMSGKSKPDGKDWRKFRPVPEWRIGAVFDGKCDRVDVEAYCGYLVRLIETRKDWFQKRNWSTAEECTQWAIHQLRLEFGRDAFTRHDGIDLQLSAAIALKVSAWGQKQMSLSR